MEPHPCPRRHLLPVAGLLLVAQVAHIVGAVALDGPTAHHPPIGNVLHVTGVLLTLVSMALLVARRRTGIALLQATAVAMAGFLVLHHGLPIDLHVNNPFWGRADAVQWVLALAVVASALLVVARVASFASRSSSATSAMAVSPVG